MKTISLVVAYLLLGLASAHAQSVSAPLHVGTTNGLVDEFGQLLAGTDPASGDFGHPVVEGDIVQIIQTTNTVMLAPSTNGLPSGLDVVVATTRIGRGVDPALGASGKFGASITTLNRSSAPVKLVARIFNAPTLEQSSFYVDSDIYSAPVYGAAKYDVFIPQFSDNATTQMLDSTDHDGDGLTRSWEISYGANPDDPDTDKDGMADGHEIRAGTGVNDANSLLQMVWLTPLPPSDMGISWDSVAGKTYQVQYTTNDLAQNPVFLDVAGGQGTALDLTSSTVVTNGLHLDAAHFRVRLVE